MIKADRILIVQTAFIGDVILVTPLIRETKKLFPASEIDILVIPATAAILANNPYLSNIYVFDKKGERIKSFFRILRTLKNGNYDLALIPHSSFTTALLVTAAGIRERVGFKGKLKSLLMTTLIDPRGADHRIDRNLSLLKPFGLSERSRQTELFPSAEERSYAQNALKGTEKTLIAVAPGSVWRTKCWLLEYYIELLNSLKERAFFVLIGSKEEKELCSMIIKESGCDGLNFAGKTSILQSAALIDQCSLILCNDSGALHLANAVKTTVFAFFGPTVRDFGFYPYREGDVIFEKDISCRPCSHHGPMKCPLKHHNCMRLITPEIVLEKINKLID
jgi:heptosyltransferase-2